MVSAAVVPATTKAELQGFAISGWIRDADVSPTRRRPTEGYTQAQMTMTA